jgi:hypothetical protein
MINNKLTYQILQLFGLFCAGTGALTVCGYMAGKPGLYTWIGDTGMALNTAIVFLVNGAALYIIGERLKYIH